jgi:hypothetical protein
MSSISVASKENFDVALRYSDEHAIPNCMEQNPSTEMSVAQQVKKFFAFHTTLSFSVVFTTDH